MLVLHKFIAAWDVADISPFCIKAETYLRFTEQEFQLRTTSNRRSKTGKLPVLQVDQEYISDSNEIIRYLESQLPNSLDSALTEEQTLVSRLLRSVIEEELYFLLMWHYYQDDKGFATYWPELANYCLAIGVKKWSLFLVKKAVRKQFLATLRAQGSGRKTRNEVDHQACEILAMIETLLGEQAYIHGAAPTTIDATVYGFLSRVLWSPFEGRIKQRLQTSPNLVAYCERIRDHYF